MELFSLSKHQVREGRGKEEKSNIQFSTLPMHVFEGWKLTKNFNQTVTRMLMAKKIKKCKRMDIKAAVSMPYIKLGNVRSIHLLSLVHLSYGLFIKGL